jgi:ribosome maturation factor RimP
VDVLIARGQGPGTLRVTVDTSQWDGRVPVEHIAKISREIGSQLDVAEAAEAPYGLEVSSPGFDRPLAREKDFENATGRQIRVETRQALEGRRKFRGTLLRFDAGIAVVEVDGSEIEIAFKDILKAKTVYQFTRADFVGNAG